MSIIRDIRSLSFSEIETFLLDNGHKKFRAKQVYEWLWKKSANSIDDMSNLSKDLRQLLNNHFEINNIKVDATQISDDRTVKVGFKLSDDKVIEGVLIPTDTRATACISSQTGCALNCDFCATAMLGKGRDLTPGEIYDQVVILNSISIEKYDIPLSNIVLMGMGEPLLNYDNVLSAIEKITSDKGLGISPKRITLSTSGVTKMIEKLADDDVKFNLAVSLHSANQETRNRIMPINKSNDLSELATALKYFYNKTQSRITFEYLLLGGVTDSLNDAKELAEFCKIVPCKINLIDFNLVEGKSYRKSTEKNTNIFIEYLESKNLIVNFRRSRGKDIDAACGQLVNKTKR